MPDKVTCSSSDDRILVQAISNGAYKEPMRVANEIVSSGHYSAYAISSKTKDLFEQLAAEWDTATQNLSSVHVILSHEKYLRIVGLGSEVIPLILTRLKDRPGMWFAALRALTDENPVQLSQRGDMAAMSDAWIQWGFKHGHLRAAPIFSRLPIASSGARKFYRHKPIDSQL